MDHQSACKSYDLQPRMHAMGVVQMQAACPGCIPWIKSIDFGPCAYIKSGES